MAKQPKRNKPYEPIICEECNLDTAVIIHEKVYYCVENAYMFWSGYALGYMQLLTLKNMDLN
jgi:hypothetical protein